MSLLLSQASPLRIGSRISLTVFLDLSDKNNKLYIDDNVFCAENYRRNALAQWNLSLCDIESNISSVFTHLLESDVSAGLYGWIFSARYAIRSCCQGTKTRIEAEIGTETQVGAKREAKTITPFIEVHR